jgi:CRP-like cAMP-binding protein
MPSVEVFKHDPRLERRDPGNVVFSEGDVAELMYVVVEGEVELRLRGVVLEVAGPGATFGEMGLLDRSVRGGTAVVKTPAKLVPIDRMRFLYLVENTPYFAIEVMRALSERLRRLDGVP